MEYIYVYYATIRCHVFGAALVTQLGIENICAEDRQKSKWLVIAVKSDCWSSKTNRSYITVPCWYDLYYVKTLLKQVIIHT